MQGTHEVLCRPASPGAISQHMDASLPTQQPALHPMQAKTASKPGKVTGKLATAVDLMVEEGLAWEKAAIKAGLTVRAMRKALAKPFVIKHLRERRDVFRASVCAANIRRLAEIRDKADNMPAVNAIKELERLGEEQNGAGRGSLMPTGLTVVVVNAPQPASSVTFPTDARNVIEHDQ